MLTTNSASGATTAPTPDLAALNTAMAAAHVFHQLSPEQQQEQLERFVGICALYGYTGFFRLQAAHAIVIGTGGVGSWAAEALCRTGVGTISLIDCDKIELSNSNRQLHTLSSTLGQSKVQTLGSRLRDINPYLDLHTYELQLTKNDMVEQLATILGIESSVLQDAQNVDLHTLPTPDALAARKIKQQEQAPVSMPRQPAQAGMTSAHQALPSLSPHLYVVDAIDDLFAKARCLDLLHRAQIPVVTSGGAGGRIDPSRVRLADIAQAHGDQLIKRLRTELRRNYDYPQGNDSLSNHRCPKVSGGNFNILCTYSDEPPIPSHKHLPTASIGAALATNLPSLATLPSFGASVNVTASSGLLLASVIIRWIIGQTNA